ncbi:MAG: hypothetical protein FJ255_00380 [Phycisphaerae bacterium]|nr:hypothetical protein [Phycisphaerae bacterium]
MTPWWDPQTAGLIGGIAGGIAGVVGGTLGAAIGALAPKGKCKGPILGAQVGFTGLGAATLASGVVAVVTGQPYHVYYPLLLVGFIATAVMGGLLPVTLARYRQAERRRLDAEELRRT